jgi:ABC-type hemin transport system substrate-binding protein
MTTRGPRSNRVHGPGFVLWILVLGSVVLGSLTLLSAQARPQRIVSLIPAVTEMLFAIGAGDQVVGVSSFDTYPAEVETKPKVGGLFDPNFERILTLRPASCTTSSNWRGAET